MKKSILFACSNIRRAKGQTVSMAVLVLLASMLLNIWLMLALDYKQNFERYHERLNAEHVTVLFDSDGETLCTLLSDTVEKDGRTEQYCMSDALWLDGTIEYSGGTLSQNFAVLEKESALQRTVGTYEIVEEGDCQSGLYLPMLYGEGDNYAVGDTVEIACGSRTKSYTVCGFFNSIMTGSHNCAICALLLTEDVYTELREEGLAPHGTLLSVRIKDRGKDEDYEAAVKNAVSEEFPSVRVLGNTYTTVSTSRYISQMICSGIVCAMAFFVTLIALVVIASNTVNYIQENMKNLGALKAVGYTGRQLTGTLQLQFFGITVAAAVLGTAVSYVFFPGLNEMMISQTGIPYQIRFLPVPLFLTFAAVCGTVALAVWGSARKIRKIEPITALREGVETHSFKRNHVPLERTRLPLNTALACKTTLSWKKQNVIIAITMLVLSLVVVFSGVMIRNVIVDMQPMVELIVGEAADSSISIAAEREKEFIAAMQEDDRVDKIYLYHTAEVRHVGHLALSAIVTDDCAELNNQNLCVEGRFPKYDNEILIAAKYAKEQGIKVGDEIVLTADGKEADYIICGLTQMSNYLGRECLMLRGAYERMGRFSYLNYYIDTADGVDVNAFNEDVSRKFTEEVMFAVNAREAIDGMAAVYVSVMKIIVLAVLFLSVTVIAFVLYLLVRTVLSHKKSEYGILKALGFTTGQLIRQTAMCFMPSLILSTAVGLFVSTLIINPLTALFLSGIGMVKCTFEIPIGFIAASGVGIVVIAFGIACLMSLRVRKIAPRELLAGE